MSSPSKPVGIPKRGSQSQSVTPAGTPDLRALRAQVISGTPPDNSWKTRRSSGSGRIAREESEPFPVPYAAPGADVTHDIYKWHLNAQRQARRVRSASFSAAARPAPDPAFEHIHEPGGFRRNYVLLRAGNEDGGEEPRVFVNNFIDFLFLFGHFAGEDLEEDEEDDKDEEDLEGVFAQPSSSVAPSVGFGDLAATESSPLLGNKSRSRSRSRRRTASMSTGNATVGQAVLMLLKGFVGTGVLFLGKAFMNGGILFSSLLFIFIAVISLHSFLLLVRAKLAVPGSFGDIGGALYGPWMRHLILSSIVLSQIGFVGAYMIFVSENLQAFVSSVTDCVQYVPVKYFIIMQSIILLPLALIRDIVKLSTTALVADAFILFGLVYIFGSEIGLVIERGTRDVRLFNPKDFSLFVGTAVFSFEGIGLIVPIVDSMREPHKFPAVLTGVMAFLLILFGGAGVLAYLTFGSDVQTVILVNLNEVHPGSRMLQIVQIFYSLAILLSVPLQLFPAIRIMENGLFTRSGKSDTRVKWTKNLFRFATVIVTGCISTLGAKDLDKFVAFVGCFACVPLCYVYPAMLHYKACAHTRRKKLADIAMIVFGLVAAAFTTVQTIKLMVEPEVSGSPVGVCGPPRV
ncbi:vacuolar amino acid transporter 4 [Lentinula edodes]|uniref:Vacuolar amino acid transporter 4 n=1 Tax=Lentinula edodes TaxID=5353 RepID=A0A1Q3E916_LENED|nr:vacuolar amino acid transporter 4 [Lentinula edodes]